MDGLGNRTPPPVGCEPLKAKDRVMRTPEEVEQQRMEGFENVDTAGGMFCPRQMRFRCWMIGGCAWQKDHGRCCSD